MSIIYRKSLKGIDEVAFKSSGLPMRLTSYLLAVDGESNIEQLAAQNPQLPSLIMVLQGLLEQGFLEVAGTSVNVVDIAPLRVSNGTSTFTNRLQQVPAPLQASPKQQLDLENYKSNMARDVAALLGADAAPVIQKIQGCQSRDDLFSTMMGIKKIITIYVNRDAAEKFFTRHQSLSS